MQTNHTYVIADHIRAACFIMADGVRPSGKQRGYVLRRLIRRALASSLALDIDISNQQYCIDLYESVVSIYNQAYPEIAEARDFILGSLQTESSKYLRAIDTGKKEWKKFLAKNESPSATDLSQKTWDLYQTHGVPFEVSESLLEENNMHLDMPELEKRIEKHQKKSQESSAGQFKSGLGEENQKTTRLHTVTHILHQVLREMFGEDVRQMGSAITTEKARFDFTKNEKLTEQEVQEVQAKVQSVIDKKLAMTKIETSESEARSMGAIGLFGEKYGDIVSVYTLTDETGTIYSREFCGGPHITNTSEIGTFSIIKQKSIGKDLKRIEYNVV